VCTFSFNKKMLGILMILFTTNLIWFNSKTIYVRVIILLSCEEHLHDHFIS